VTASNQEIMRHGLHFACTLWQADHNQFPATGQQLLEGSCQPDLTTIMNLPAVTPNKNLAWA
jgi:hypothetical protein